MKNRYFENPEYNYEKVNRASQACGPMVKWAIAQVGCQFFAYKLQIFCARARWVLEWMCALGGKFEFFGF